MPVFFFAISQAPQISWINALLIFIVLHLFVYPASNGYNSYMDQDESSIAGLENPPMATIELFYISMGLDMIGLFLALLINFNFFLCVLTYQLASRAYSFKGIRLKKYPILGFLIVVFSQGVLTYWMVLNGVSNPKLTLESQYVVLAACFFLIGGVYPMTQIYQHAEDHANGDFTISYKLGKRGTFIFTAIMFIISNVFLYIYFEGKNQLTHFLWFQILLQPVIGYFMFWFFKVWKNPLEATYKNTMRLNFIAASFMNLVFIIILILNHI